MTALSRTAVRQRAALVDNTRLLSAIAALLVLAMLMPAWWAASAWYEQRLLGDRRAQVAAELTGYGNALSAGVSRQFTRLEALRGYVQAQLETPDALQDEEFATFAQGLHAGTSGVRSFTVAPSGVQRLVYPIAGNEGIVGSNMLTDPRPEVRVDVDRAIQTRQMALGGPYELAQGGLGLVARYAVYQGTSLWGLVTMTLDVPPLLAESGIDPLPRGLDVGLAKGFNVFYGQREVFLSQPVSHRVDLPEGTWELAAVPRQGWAAAVAEPLRLFQISGLCIVLLISGLTYVTFNRQARLAQSVRERTRQLTSVNQELQRDIEERKRTEQALRESEERFRRLADAAPVMLWVTDATGTWTFFNRSWLYFTGRTLEQNLGEGWLTTVHPDDRQRCLDELGRAFVAHERFHLEFRMRAADGHYRDVETTGVPRFTPDGEFMGFIGSSDDVTEERLTQRELEQRVEERTREIERRHRVAEGLRDIMAVLNSNQSLDQILDAILAQTERLLGADAASIYRPHGPDRILRIQAARGLPADYVAGVEIPFGQGTAGLAMKERRPVPVPDLPAAVADDTRFPMPVPTRAWFALLASRFGALISVPLVYKDEAYGALSVIYREPREFSPDEIALAVAFADQAALAIENARLFEQAQQVATLEERHRLARELHDAVTQTLFSASLIAEVLPRLWDRNPEEGQRRLAELRQLTRGALAEMRTLLLELRPEALAEMDLVTLLRQLAEAFTGRAGLAISFVSEGERSLPTDVRFALYRIAQEALNNVVKHANATEVDVHLASYPDRVELRVRDNGRGFTPGDVPAGHLGMSSMRERAQALYADFTVQSEPGGGTEVRVVWRDPEAALLVYAPNHALAAPDVE